MRERAQAPGRELGAYLCVVAAYFFAFGLQMVLFSSLATFVLNENARRVGLAQIALSAPMFMLLLFGGVLAERVRASRALFLMHLLFAIPPLLLALAIFYGRLSYPLLIIYGIAMGTLAAFMLPVRDAALNGVVAREQERGAKFSLSQAAALTTVTQLGGQIIGFMVGSIAGAWTARLLIVQAALVAVAGSLALLLRTPRPERKERPPAATFRDIAEGLRYAFRDPVMGPMLWSAAYIGVFVVGSFQVLFPLIVRAHYDGGPQELGRLYASFFAASFVSAAILTRIPSPLHPGRALLLSHAAGAVVLATFVFSKPLWMFTLVVALWGLASGVAMSMSRTITQSSADPTFLSRVLAVYSMGFLGGAPIGAFLVGATAEWLGPAKAALVPAIGLALACFALAILSPIWRLKRSQ